MSGRIVRCIKLVALVVSTFLAISTSAQAAPPTAVVVVSPTQLGAGQTANVTITFSQPVTGFDLSDLTFSNATLSGLSTPDNVTYTTTLTAASGVAVPTNHVVVDLPGVMNGSLETGSGTAVSNNYSVGPVSQSITLGAQAPQTFVSGGTFAINPLATASSGLAVTYSSLTTGVCTVSGSTVTMIAAGTCTLAADQAGNGTTYAAASQVTRNVALALTTSSVALVASPNPSLVGQAVTFTATVSGLSPTGTVTFRDGATTLGTGILSSGRATLTISALTSGTHAITAVYSGDTSNATGTSAALLQAVSTSQDSLKLRALQVIATKTVAQNSGAAITGAVDAAISEGFSDGGDLITPGASGVRFNFSADPAQREAATGLPGSADSHAPSKLPQGASGVDDAFAAINRNAMPVKVPALRYVEPKDWLLWADVRGSRIDSWESSTSTPILYGTQINALLGLTRRLTPNFLVGALGGYETFDYRSDALSGHLKGDGWTAGSYLGWRFAPGLRLDAAAAYSGIGYNAIADTAIGKFGSHRWLVSGGLTGDTKAYGFGIEPSAKIYALWESENAYTDSLGMPQADRWFFTGRASAGLKVSYPWVASAAVALAPYAGLYADYYFTGDDAAASALAGAMPLASVPLLDGWSARATGGLAVRLGNEASVAVGAELGGIGSKAQIWTFRGRASIPF
ncbi:autotransporter domain-containing protein [Bradyrhizobium sp. 18BD]